MPPGQKSTATSVVVSIGLPVFNGADFLTEALESILAQDFEDFELIIADNASTDDTPNICQRYADRDDRITYIRHPKNMGAAKNYNYVVHASRGTYFKWAAHDDVLAPGFLTACLKGFETADDKTMLVYPNFAFTDADLIPLEQKFRYIHTVSDIVPVRLWQTLFGFDRVTSIFGLFRRDLLSNTKLIDTYEGSDFDLLFETALLGKIIKLDGDVLFFRRMHDNISTKAARDSKQLLAWFDTDSHLTLRTQKPRRRRFLSSILTLPGLRFLDRLTCALFLPFALAGVKIHRNFRRIFD
ncbi:MAG: glycosyltransferase [Rhodobacteraceae bacterium]|nr:glycosyltransferase [Paracoccaceae bacterium]